MTRPYRSGFCGNANHGRCKGVFGAAECACPCHVEPAPAAELVYSDDLVELWHGDALAWLGWAANGDVMLTDPPYGIAYESNRPRVDLARSIEGDEDTAARDEALEVWGDKPAIVFGSWKAPRPAATRALLVWDTKGANGMGAMDLPWKPAHQEMYVLGTGFTGHRGSDVYTVAPVQSLGYNGREHPNQKPLPLLAQLIDKCPPGTIVDPFAGSGSTLVAAKAAGRKAIGVEIDRAYCDIAIRRLGQEAMDFNAAS